MVNPGADGGGLPLLPERVEGPLVWRDGQTIDRDTFIAHVGAVAGCLPVQPFVANLCVDRYHFMVAFAAVGLRGQTNLLPTSRVEGALAEARAHYPGSVSLGDAEVGAWIADARPAAAVPSPAIPAGHVMAIAFTSGSTGTSQPQRKRWGELVAGARLAERRFQFGAAGRPTVVATVPPQHMYGLETTILLPLATGLPVHARQPFFPDDICATLAAVPAPRVLVTTPAHLRVCVRAALRWPALDRIISATAPLPRPLAAACEQAFETMVLKIYGLTEAGSVASRRTLTDDLWTPYDGITVEDGWIRAAHLPQPVRPADILEPRGANRFALAGRQADIVNIAGKRTSLGYLTQVLLEIDGVEDAVFVRPEASGERQQRLLAVVVAPRLRREDILAGLGRRIDPVFLPRPLLMVQALPRDLAGKLPRAAVARLIGELQGAGPADADVR